jgi:hypothetical protein
MHVVVHQTPTVDKSTPLGAGFAKPFEKIFPVALIDENLAALNPAESYVMQDTRAIETGSTWHDASLTSNRQCVTS